MRLPFLRSKSDAGGADSRLAAGDDKSTLQAVRIQARRRLMGAVVLLVVAVAGFPLLFETTPRPMPGKDSLEGGGVVIRSEGMARSNGAEGASSRNAAAAPLPNTAPAATPDPPPASVARQADQALAAPAGPAAAEPTETSTTAVVTAATAAASKVVAGKRPELQASAPALRAAATKPAVPPGNAAVASAAEKASPAPSAAAKSEKAEKAAPPPAAASAPGPTAGETEERWVVQVGAYNDMERMRLARQKAEKLGFKTYTTEVDTPTGKRTRVRLGPFANKKEAEAAAAKVKSNGMAANVLSL